jgi:hypothetical protein
MSQMLRRFLVGQCRICPVCRRQRTHASTMLIGLCKIPLSHFRTPSVTHCHTGDLFPNVVCHTADPFPIALCHRSVRGCHTPERISSQMRPISERLIHRFRHASERGWSRSRTPFVTFSNELGPLGEVLHVRMNHEFAPANVDLRLIGLSLWRRIIAKRMP